ncbi:hypothetical protein C4J81_00635 [Deltaproteobacteria bacterium Smac51]|nr:hypothetical protein C4J81_00635 [Deltaproteobacteria bacterium Smac51]
MKPFKYLEPRTLAEAFEMKRGRPSAVYLAGGTDVVPLMKYDLIFPEAVISLEHIPELGEVAVSGQDLVIGGMTRLHQLEQALDSGGRILIDSPGYYGTALAGLGRAARSVASPQIRRLGTVAGNLRQYHRCFYYNQTAMWRQGIETCLKDGGSVCHQAPGKKTCQALHYSDLAPALLAAGAKVMLFRGQEMETVPLDALWSAPALLNDGTLIVKIIIPEIFGLKGLFFRKRAARAAIDFPLANAALAWRSDGRVSLSVGAMSPEVFFLKDTADLISQKLQTGAPWPENLEETAEKEARKKMRPIREATVSPAVKIKAMAAAVREVLADIRNTDPV